MKENIDIEVENAKKEFLNDKENIEKQMKLKEMLIDLLTDSIKKELPENIKVNFDGFLVLYKDYIVEVERLNTLNLIFEEEKTDGTKAN